MKTLIIVDMQNDFITGPLGTPEAREVEDRIADWLEHFSYDMIMLTRDTHYDYYYDTQEGKKLPIIHCVDQSNGWQISEKITEAINKSNIPWGYIDKRTFGFSMWEETPLRGKENDEILIVGVCTDICVISNALILKSQYPEATIRVISSLCAGTTPEMHEKALAVMRSCQIEVI